MEKIEKLNTSIEFLDDIFNASGVPIFVKDSDHQFIKANKAFCSFVGLSIEDIIGKKLDESFPEEQRKHFWEIDDLVLETGIENVCEEVITTNSNELRTIITTKKRFGETEDKYLVGVIHDISERKKNELELLQKNEELFRLNSEKDKLFSIIAHDLRGPFNSILGFTQLMAEGECTPEEIPRMAMLVNNSASNLFKLLENLLEWSRMQRGVIKFESTSFALKLFLSMNVDKVIKHIYEKKGIEVTYVIPGDIQVTGDLHMIESIMRNLMSNAIKFTPRNGKINVSAQKIDNQNVRISIRDTGIGMDQKTIERLFSLEEKSCKAGTEGEPSTGLGLIICKDFVEKNHGKIWVESEEGKGSTFHFTLPK